MTSRTGSGGAAFVGGATRSSDRPGNVMPTAPGAAAYGSTVRPTMCRWRRNWAHRVAQLAAPIRALRQRRCSHCDLQRADVARLRTGSTQRTLASSQERMPVVRMKGVPRRSRRRRASRELLGRGDRGPSTGPIVTCGVPPVADGLRWRIESRACDGTRAPTRYASPSSNPRRRPRGGRRPSPGCSVGLAVPG